MPKVSIFYLDMVTIYSFYNCNILASNFCLVLYMMIVRCRFALVNRMCIINLVHSVRKWFYFVKDLKVLLNRVAISAIICKTTNAYRHATGKLIVECSRIMCRGQHDSNVLLAVLIISTCVLRGAFDCKGLTCFSIDFREVWLQSGRCQGDLTACSLCGNCKRWGLYILVTCYWCRQRV